MVVLPCERSCCVVDAYSAVWRRWSRRKRPGVTPTRRWNVRVNAAWSPKPDWLAMSDAARGNDLAIHPEPVVGCRYRPHEHRDEHGGHARGLVNRVGKWPGGLHADDRETIGVAMRSQRRRLVETH